MELHAIGLSPELVNWEDGARAAFVVALPLALLLVTGRSELGWAIFAAFWTCLADSGGPLKRRIGLSALFALPGAVVAFLASWFAGLGMVCAIVAGPLLVFLCGLLPYYRPAAGLVATLLAVVAVVAGGYPHHAIDAATLGGMFLGGSLWAMVVIEGLWRGDVSRPARQAVSAVFARLSDMAFDIASGEVGEADQQAVHYSQHRRAVRAAIERAEMQVANGRGRRAMIVRGALVSADEVFHALLALDHRRSGDPMVWVDLRDIGGRLAGIARQLRRGGAVQPQDAIAVRYGSASEAGAFRAIDSALEAMTGGRGTATASEAPVPTPAADGHRLKRTVLHAQRIAAVVAIVTATAHALGLGYPYWAAMAVIVVLHPVRRMSVARGVERILGSVAGGAVASLLLPWLEAPAVVAVLVLGGTLATIALRSVNYTIFVAFLSVIFVLVMHTLHPAEGLAGMRILDNVVGSVAAIASVLVFSPRGGPSLATRIAEAVAANRAYLEAIESEDPAKVTSARRAAGLASIEAEMAAHMPGHIFGAAISTQEAQGLAEARRLAGEAAARWHDKVTG